MARRDREHDGEIVLARKPRADVVTVPKHKHCVTCMTTKPAADFWRALSAPDCLSANCKTCTVINAQRDRAEREARQAALEAKKREAEKIHTKRCACCKVEKPFVEFARHKQAKDGHRKDCIDCVANAKVKRKPSAQSEASKIKARERTQQPQRRQTMRTAVRAWKQRNPEALKAQSAVRVAIKIGVLVRPPRCQVRGCKSHGKMQAHHFDYRYPLVVSWCCAKHHRQLHSGDKLEIVTGLPPELLRIPGQQTVAI